MAETTENTETIEAPIDDRITDITMNDFYNQLSDKLSDFNAKLLLHTVKVGAGVLDQDDQEKLNVDEAKTICLELIKKGGPAFQVGKSMYNQIQ